MKKECCECGGTCIKKDTFDASSNTYLHPYPAQSYECKRCHTLFLKCDDCNILFVDSGINITFRTEDTLDVKECVKCEVVVCGICYVTSHILHDYKFREDIGYYI